MRVLWSVYCPICKKQVEFTTNDYTSYSKDDKNILECKDCHIALYAEPYKISFINSEYIPNEDKYSVTVKETEVIVYEKGKHNG